MAEKLEPAADQFVVRLAPTARLPEAIATLGSAEKLGSDRPLYLVRVGQGHAARESWQVLARHLGDAAFVYPVLVDSDGAPHYPTGEVTVRFEKVPTPAELEAFAGDHDLRLLRANEFAPRQFVLEPVKCARDFLPDLVSRLAAVPGVRAAWANTLSRYRKSAR